MKYKVELLKAKRPGKAEGLYRELLEKAGKSIEVGSEEDRSLWELEFRILDAAPQLLSFYRLEPLGRRKTPLKVKRSFVERIRADPAIFATEVLGFEPYPYQERLLRDPSKRIVVCAGRQVGKSTIIAIKALHFALSRPRSTTLLISATLRQSMLLFDKVLEFIEASKIELGLSYRSRTRIRLLNGSWIIALPCGRFGHTLRGHTAHLVILDEAAYIPDDVIAGAIFPQVSATDGFIWMLSTPWSRDHIFYRCFTSPTWSRHHLPSYLNPKITSSFLEEQRELIGEERYSREYLAEFVEEPNTYFPMSLLRSCLKEGPHQPPQELWAGYDPGGKESYAALVLVGKGADGRLWVELAEQWRLPSYSLGIQLVVERLKGKGIAGLLVDSTGLGGPVLEQLKELGLPAKGLLLTQKSKAELLQHLRILLEQRRLTLPYDDALLASLNCIKAKMGASGLYRFESGVGAHDDLAYALALACWGAREAGPSTGAVVRIG